MISQERGVPTEIRVQQLAVRFAHAPCVKLTLQSGTTSRAQIPGTRVLRLGQGEALTISLFHTRIPSELSTRSSRLN